MNPLESVCKVTTIQGSLVGSDLRIGIVVARFNDLVTKPLLEGALEAFTRHGVMLDDCVARTSLVPPVTWVPGSFELPVVAKSMARSDSFDVILCIGAVVRGSTTHYDAVANSAASGILSAATDTGVPIIFGVLTCETMEQALDRAGGKLGNKGGEAAITAIEMGNLLRDMRDKDYAA